MSPTGYKALAKKAEQASNAAYRQGYEMGRAISFGQPLPILEPSPLFLEDHLVFVGTGGFSMVDLDERVARPRKQA